MLKSSLLKALSNRPLLSDSLLKVTIHVGLTLFSKTPEPSQYKYWMWLSIRENRNYFARYSVIYKEGGCKLILDKSNKVPSPPMEPLVFCRFRAAGLRFRLRFLIQTINDNSWKISLSNIQSLSASWWQSVTQLCKLTFLLVLKRLFVDVERLCCLKLNTDLIIRIMLTNGTPFCSVFKRYMR